MIINWLQFSTLRAPVIVGVLATAVVAAPASSQTQRPGDAPRATQSQKAPGQPQTDLPGLMRQLMTAFSGGKYADAIVIQKQLIAEFDRMGAAEHPMQAANYASLGDLYRFTGDFAEAEKNHKRALAMREKAFGREHADVASSLMGLHQLAAAQGRFGDAEGLLTRALAMRERLLPPDDPELTMTRISVAKLYAQQGRHEAAEPVLRAALDALRQKLGAEHPYVGVAVNNLADTLVALGRYAEAEPLLKTAVELTEKAAGAASPLAATALNNLAELYRAQGRYPEAEELRRRELSVREAAVGPDSLDLATSLNNFGTLLAAQRRPQEAEAILRRSLAIQERYLKPDHPDIAVTLNNIADVLGQTGRRADADALYRRVLGIREAAFGATHNSVSRALDNLSVSLIEQNRFAEAEPLSRRALAITEASLPPGHPLIALSLNNLATALDSLGRHDEARVLLERALQLRRAGLGDEHPDVMISLLNLGSNALDRGDWQLAYDTLATAGRQWRSRQGVMAGRLQNTETQATGELEQIRGAFLGLAVAAERLRGGSTNAQGLIAAAFEAVQDSSGSVAASALARAGARAAARSPRLAAVVRERQDLAEQFAARDRQLFTELGKLNPARDQARIDQLRASQATLTSRSAALDVTIGREFPDYADLITPKPLPLNETQALLGADEALIVIAPTRLGTLVWAVTRDAVQLVRSELTGRDATAKISALRCGLDHTRWIGKDALACLDAVKQSPEGDLLPFDTKLAHELYRDVFGQIEDVIRGRHLLVVAADAFTTLPLHVLVTAPPTPGLKLAARLREAAWLGRRQSITTLASVSGLKIDRGQKARAAAVKPFIGFANPLLLGAEGTDRRAFERQSCPAPGAKAAAGPVRRSLAGPGFPGRGIDIETLRRGSPLPETTDEVCAVAKALNAADADVYLGARATVRTIKQLAQRGALADYRVLHFATHGLVGGGRTALEQGLSEPAILLTPPASGTTGRALAEDDGLLGASDIAALNLNADWVVMSACNTAAGSASNAEPLSGLARAFFHAGARSLLVSHWEVDSAAAVQLTTRAFAEIARNPQIRRSQALQVAMTALMASDNPQESHPAHWAPFVVVGDGGAGR
jgi:CHAT domain-containing protein/tetratricopeptide (TPR) repeat protein